jgi:hypothetical protein
MSIFVWCRMDWQEAANTHMSYSMKPRSSFLPFLLPPILCHDPAPTNTPSPDLSVVVYLPSQSITRTDSTDNIWLLDIGCRLQDSIDEEAEETNALCSRTIFPNDLGWDFCPYTFIPTMYRFWSMLPPSLPPSLPWHGRMVPLPLYVWFSKYSC